MGLWSDHRRRRDGGSAQRCRRRLVLEYLEGRWLLSGGYAQLNLASDVPGVARVTDPNLINPWGIGFSPTGPFWFADNGGGVADLLDGHGQPLPLVVTLSPTTQSNRTPTGVVFNGGPGFLVSENGVSAPSRFLFATEDGIISGWTAVADWTHTLPAVDNSSSGAVYKGLALATDATGRSFLYATDFGRGTIDVFDQSFKPVARSGSFQDPNLPNGFAPFNIENIHDLLFVTYAQRDEAGRDDNPGAGHGFIDVYDPAGNLVKRLASQGALNSPWGLALAPAEFGPFGGALLVGNNGDGHINAFDPQSGAFLGAIADDNGNPITVSRLWALNFGNGHLGGAADTLFFTAGINNEAHGLFGAIQPPERKGADTAGSGPFDPHAPGEPGDYPLPPSTGPAFRDGDHESGSATAVLFPLMESSLVLIPTLNTVAGAMRQANVVVPAGPVGAFMFQELAGASPLDPRSAISSPPTAEGPYPRRAPNNFLAVHAFLDLNVDQSTPVNPAREEDLQGNPDAGGTRRSPGAANEVEAPSLLAEPPLAGMKTLPYAQTPESALSRQADQVLTRVPSESKPGSVAGRHLQNEVAHTNNRRSWMQLLMGLLVVVSGPLISALCGPPRPDRLRPLEKAGPQAFPLLADCRSRARLKKIAKNDFFACKSADFD